MSKARPGLTPQWQTRARCFLLLAVMMACLSACQTAPDVFVAQLDQAVRSGDTERVASMLTPESRALYRALPEALRRAPAKPSALRIVEVRRAQAGLLLRVSAGGRESSWVLRKTGRSWLLDLSATTDQHSFDSL